jgi:acylphosphatase
MNQCVRITLVVSACVPVFKRLIQKNAQKLAIEGVGSVSAPNALRIIAHGDHDAIDEFIDALYTGCKGIRPSLIEVEPFVKDRDYRGIFRIIG